jgi:hypothetical protein
VVAGQSYPVTASATLVDPGFLVGLRAGFRASGSSPWLEAARAAWPRTHTVSVTGTGRNLPAFEAFLGEASPSAEERETFAPLPT